MAESLRYTIGGLQPFYTQYCTKYFGELGVLTKGHQRKSLFAFGIFCLVIQQSLQLFKRRRSKKKIQAKRKATAARKEQIKHRVEVIFSNFAKVLTLTFLK